MNEGRKNVHRDKKEGDREKILREGRNVKQRECLRGMGPGWRRVCVVVLCR